MLTQNYPQRRLQLERLHHSLLHKQNDALRCQCSRREFRLSLEITEKRPSSCWSLQCMLIIMRVSIHLYIFFFFFRSSEEDKAPMLLCLIMQTALLYLLNFDLCLICFISWFILGSPHTSKFSKTHLFSLSLLLYSFLLQLKSFHFKETC